MFPRPCDDAKVPKTRTFLLTAPELIVTGETAPKVPSGIRSVPPKGGSPLLVAEVPPPRPRPIDMPAMGILCVVENGLSGCVERDRTPASIKNVAFGKNFRSWSASDVASPCHDLAIRRKLDGVIVAGVWASAIHVVAAVAPA